MARGNMTILRSAQSVQRQPAFALRGDSSRTSLWIFLSLISWVSACAVFYVAIHIQVVRLGYKISQELQKKESLIEENKRLNLEVARLKSPTRIEHEAKTKLGLVLPKPQQIFYLSQWDGGVPALPELAKSQVTPHVAIQKNKILVLKNSDSKKNLAKSSFEKKQNKDGIAKIIAQSTNKKPASNLSKSFFNASQQEKIPALMLDPIP